jgi:glycosyltransferase involved in cell wall biosynthesis
MAAGLPIVATPVGEVEAMIGGSPGYVVQDFDAERFADAVESVTHGGPRVPAPRTEEYSQVRITTRLLEVYDTVLEN